MNLNRLIAPLLLLAVVAAGCSTPESPTQTTPLSASPATSTPPSTSKPTDSPKSASPSTGSEPAGSSAPGSKPVPAQSGLLRNAAALPGDTAALLQRLRDPGKIQVELILVEDPVTADRTTYLDNLLAQRGELDPASLLLLLFTKEGYDIRFAMGSIFHQKQFTVAEMLTLVRDYYLPKARKGDPAGGLADYLQAVDQGIDL